MAVEDGQRHSELGADQLDAAGVVLEGWTDDGVAMAIGDGELTSFSHTTVSLHEKVGAQAATPFVFFQDCLDMYSRHRDQIMKAVVESRQRLVSCDLTRYAMQRMRESLEKEEAETGSYPWADRVVFRSGNYIVFRVSGHEMPEWLRFHFSQ